jgi:hypothetical protein
VKRLVTLREKRRLSVFENRVLRRIFGPTSYIIRVIKASLDEWDM